MTENRMVIPHPSDPFYQPEQPPEDYGDKVDREYTNHKDEHDNTQ